MELGGARGEDKRFTETFILSSRVCNGYFCRKETAQEIVNFNGFHFYISDIFCMRINTRELARDNRLPRLNFLVSLRVHRTESQYFYLYRCRLGLCVKKYIDEKTKRRQSLASIFSAIKNHSNFYLVVCFGVVSFRVQITPEPRPDWSPLGV